MIKYFNFSLTLIAAALLVSCQKEIKTEETPSNMEVRTFTCSFANVVDSKVSVSTSLGEYGKTRWEVGDQIVVFGKNKSENIVVPAFTSENIKNDGKDAEFSIVLPATPQDADGSGLGGDPYYAAYPADCFLTYPESGSKNYRICGFSDTNRPLMAAYLADGSSEFKFYNLCSAIAFTVIGDDYADYDQYIFEGNKGETVGFDECYARVASDTYHSLVYKISTGAKKSIVGTFAKDAVNFIFIPGKKDGAGTHFTEGFRIHLVKEGVPMKTIITEQDVDMAIGDLLRLGTIPAGKIHSYTPLPHTPADWTSTAINLNKDALDNDTDPANCYMLTTSDNNKVFKFKAVQGNSSMSVGSIESVDLLWETYISGTAPASANTIIEKLDFDATYVYFKTPEASIHEGNALIAAKDVMGNVLWSWHIWVPGSTVTYIDDGLAASGKIMDRNLGALYAATTSSAPMNTFGLYYQWGRKDPFYSNKMKGYPGVLPVTNEKASTDDAVKHPTVYYYDASGNNWNTTNVTTLWENSGKTIYDPCPSGYRVPVYDTNFKLWGKTDIDWTFGASSDYAKQVDYDSVFPMPGYLNNSSELYPSESGGRTIIWAATPNSSSKGYAAFFYLSQSSKYNRDQYYKNMGGNIRCVAE